MLTAGRTKRAPQAPWDDKSIPIVSCSSETNKGQPVTLTQLHLFPFDWWKESKTLHSKCAIYFPPQNQILTHMPICFFLFFFTNTTIRHNTLLRSETSYCNVISASAFLIQPEWIFGWFKRSLANLDTMEGKNWDTAVHAVPSVFHNSHSNCSLKSSSSKLDRLFFFCFFSFLYFYHPKTEAAEASLRSYKWSSHQSPSPHWTFPCAVHQSVDADWHRAVKHLLSLLLLSAVSLLDPLLLVGSLWEWTVWASAK